MVFKKVGEKFEELKEFWKDEDKHIEHTLPFVQPRLLEFCRRKSNGFCVEEVKLVEYTADS